MNSGLLGLLHHRLRYPLFAAKQNGPPRISSKMFKMMLFWPSLHLLTRFTLLPRGFGFQSLTLCVSPKKATKREQAAENLRRKQSIHTGKAHHGQEIPVRLNADPQHYEGSDRAKPSKKPKKSRLMLIEETSPCLWFKKYP